MSTSPSSTPTTIFVLYNAKASILGKLTYGYRKICSNADQPACAACDLTHGGLKLDESAEWKETKQKIPAQIKQLHQDELTPELSGFMKSQGLKFPVILGQQTPDSPLLPLMTADDLKTVSKDHSQFLKALEAKAHENHFSWPEASTQTL
jgi:hypothetical protein